jgi:hypothetical protein
MGCHHSTTENEAPIQLEGQLYTREPSGCVICTVQAVSERTSLICIRGRICCSGELARVSELFPPGFLNPVCVPSSIEVFRRYPPGGVTFPASMVVAFEWRSRLRQISFIAISYARLRFFCVPASVESFEQGLVGLRASLELITFESSVASLHGSALCPDPGPCVTLVGRPTYILGGGNPHFAMVGHSLMNVGRTTLIRHCVQDDLAITIDSTVEELAPGSFEHVSMRTLTFSQPSRLRVIGAGAFESCRALGLVVLPWTVEVIGAGAFSRCDWLQEVRIERGSRLRLVAPGAFARCPHLGSVDVPATARIGGRFTVIAPVYDEDGSALLRVHFAALLPPVRAC